MMIFSQLFSKWSVCITFSYLPFWLLTPGFLYVCWANELTPCWHNIDGALHLRKYQNMGGTT